ncbi:hypothetical protein [Chryseobacterium cheonjiense]|uniref:Lipid/polyisoprenoid-binding YceI-like domain-containing protein n=1 Tax=Chryseobacterium cheonjiense TaxID=2728845 RepID=A0A7Y0A3X5_9FLAO|nr:hypothetical protein [Chryseobacterium cheonjiense]NML56191.1 hypothetical protein [Chryseobacterium cheonjiense]
MKAFLTVVPLLFGIFMSAQDNYIQISGSTNINTFKCTNNTFRTPGGNFSISERNLPNIALKVDDFDCRNKMMTSDFQKTLSAEDHPYLNIRFLSLDKNKAVYNAQIEVKMINRSKIYNITFCLENGKLTGKRSVKFSDFNILPPTKMGGMIVVKDDLNLVFALAANTQ